MITAVICLTAFFAAGLTFFTGFGLGTLLMPAFALFFPVEQAVALTAVVHFLNGLFKLVLVGKHARREVVIRFGLPAILTALVGALLLLWVSDLAPLHSYSLGGRKFQITPVKLVLGCLLLVFALAELLPVMRRLSFSPRYLPLGGALSGFFGGLSGHQGALRSAFLTKVGLSKEEFIGSSVVIACLIDFTRIVPYTTSVMTEHERLDFVLLAAAVVAAFAGTWLGNRYLKKMTMTGIQIVVAVLLFAVAIGLMSGLL